MMLIRVLAAMTLAVTITAAGIASEPDFGPKVLVFDPSQKDIQERVNAVFKEQERAQFGTGALRAAVQAGPV